MILSWWLTAECFIPRAEAISVTGKGALHLIRIFTMPRRVSLAIALRKEKRCLSEITGLDILEGGDVADKTADRRSHRGDAERDERMEDIDAMGRKMAIAP